MYYIHTLYLGAQPGVVGVPISTLVEEDNDKRSHDWCCEGIKRLDVDIMLEQVCQHFEIQIPPAKQITKLYFSI